MSQVELAKILSLIFYKDAYTAARRTSALPQLVCVGKPCRLFQPDVIRCVNLGGGYGTNVDWKCEADLPDSLRFGKVEVSCEGWSRPGDPYVLKGSCSLEYRIVQVPGSLRDGSTDSPIFDPKSYDWPTILFYILWIGVLIIILYSLFRSCFWNNTTPRVPRYSGSHPGPGGGSGWFPGYHTDNTSAPPPPYSKTPQHPTGSGWRPGFWTGAALGGLANHIWNRQRDEPVRATSYDWERYRQPQPQPRMPFFGGGGSRPVSNEDRGEGSSNLGSMRRSTGLGGSKVR